MNNDFSVKFGKADKKVLQENQHPIHKEKVNYLLRLKKKYNVFFTYFGDTTYTFVFVFVDQKSVAVGYWVNTEDNYMDDFFFYLPDKIYLDCNDSVDSEEVMKAIVREINVIME